MKQFSAIIALALLLVLSACGKKTEREQYEEVRSSLKYKTYKTVSEKIDHNAVDLVSGTVGAGKVPDIDEMTTRLLLGYGWAVTKKDAFAFAEADIVIAKAKLPSEKFLAHSINSITMYEMGWVELSKEESGLANEAINKAPDDQSTKIQIAVYHLILGSLMMKDKKFDAARFHFAGFGQATGINWPYQLVDAIADIESGKIQQGLQKIKRMSQDPAVPVEVREILAKAISDVEKNTGGDVDSSLFWPKAILGILVDQLKDSSVEEVKALGVRMQKMRETLSF